MVATRFRLARVVSAVAVGMACCCLIAGVARADDPVVWYENDDRPVPAPEPNFPKETISIYEESISRPVDRFFHPTRFLRRLGGMVGGEIARPAANVNAYDEVPGSTWFTNRIGLSGLLPERCEDGGRGEGPLASRPWRVLGAKTDGVTPGFRFEDAEGNHYLLKFDPAGFPGSTVRASLVSGLILHACGYNTPDEYVVQFDADDLIIADDLTYRPQGGGEISLTAENLATILGPAHTPDGKWLALASRYLAGTAIGPFDFKGRRGDDPNDRIDHEDRRELRGLRVIGAWLNHFDAKRDNTLDVYVGDPGQGHVRHYLIDFASTLGSGGSGPCRKWGWEYSLDVPAVTGRALALGLHEDRWVDLERPAGLDDVGYFESADFDVEEWKPMRPNTAYANLTERDGYWAAKIVTAFSDEQLRRIVAQAGYENDSKDYLVRTLAARRDIIGRYWFDRVPPLDFFSYADGVVRFDDLGAERGIYPDAESSYRYRWRSSAGGWSNWQEGRDTHVNTGKSGAAPPVRFQCQVSRGGGWSGTTEIRITADGRIAELER